MENYPHQTKVADLILKGKNVILQAPTGAGKTRAALLAFLEAWHDKSDAYKQMPTRCIYSVPMRVLATQFSHEYDKIVRKYTTQKALKSLNVTIQTGESQEDPQLTGNLIFATIDQTLSSFLISPYSLSKSRANLNAGAVASSYLVFDEFHLFDPDSTLPTTLHMLKMLKGITPFILMTATFSKTMLGELAKELDAVVVGDKLDELEAFSKLPSQDKTRFYHAVDDRISAESVIEKHRHYKGRGSLVICNTVERARRLFEEIREQASNTEVLLLHSRFLAADRRQTEDKIRTVFGKEADGADTIVVSTQSIEVGVDMSSTVLHTELAPANAIIQRAGRCARYAGEEGHIYIYKRALDKDGEEIDLREKTAPYLSREDASVISKTWDAFTAKNGDEFSYASEQEVLSAAHEEQDKQTIQFLREDSFEHKKGMFAAIRGEEDARNYIRHIIAQQVTIFDTSKKEDFEKLLKNPFAYPSFSLHPGTIQGYLKDWLANREHKNQIMVIRSKDNEDAAQSNEERYEAIPVENNSSEAWMATLLVIHPNLACYDPELGFLADEAGGWHEKPDVKQVKKEKSSNENGLRLETYERHIELVYQAFINFWPEAEWAARKLEERFDWERGSVEKAAKLAVLLHDVGKLSKGWQGWVGKYQAALIEQGVVDDEEKHRTLSGTAYAHTDSLSDDERYREIANSIRPKRPWHAVEGALSVILILKNELQNGALTKAAYSAICRHHTPFSFHNEEYALIPDAIVHIENVFCQHRYDINSPKINTGAIKEKDLKGKNVITLNDSPTELEIGCFLAYLLIVRTLRRADSFGTGRGKEEKYD